MSFRQIDTRRDSAYAEMAGSSSEPAAHDAGLVHRMVLQEPPLLPGATTTGVPQ